MDMIPYKFKVNDMVLFVDSINNWWKLYRIKKIEGNRYYYKCIDKCSHHKSESLVGSDDYFVTGSEVEFSGIVIKDINNVKPIVLAMML